MTAFHVLCGMFISIFRICSSVQPCSLIIRCKIQRSVISCRNPCIEYGWTRYLCQRLLSIRQIAGGTLLRTSTCLLSISSVAKICLIWETLFFSPSLIQSYWRIVFFWGCPLIFFSFFPFFSPFLSSPIDRTWKIVQTAGLRKYTWILTFMYVNM